NATFNEVNQRHPPHNRFVEISNFDSTNDNLFADRVIDMLRAHVEIDHTVMQGVSFCIGEIIGNIHFHSESLNGGWVVAQYYKNNTIRILVCDSGIGIFESLTTCDKYAHLNEKQCIETCVENGVTNGK